MPHFQIEYSANIEEVVDIGALCEAIRAAAAEIDTFPMAGIRVRATCVDHVAIADGDPKQAQGIHDTRDGNAFHRAFGRDARHLR